MRVRNEENKFLVTIIITCVVIIIGILYKIKQN